MADLAAVASSFARSIFPKQILINYAYAHPIESV